MGIIRDKNSEIQSNIKIANNSSIKLLSESEYNSLDNEEKKEYIPYNPSMNDKGIASIIRQADTQLKVLSELFPLYYKMYNLPSPVITEKFEEIGVEIEKLEEPLKVINDLSKEEIIGKLAENVSSMASSMNKLIGLAYYLIIAIALGKDIFMDSICKSYENCDYDKLKETLKEKTEEEKNSNKINYESIPSNEIKKKVENAYDKINSNQEKIVSCINSAISQKKVSQTSLSQYTWDNIKEKLIPILESSGINCDELSKPTENEKKEFTSLFPNPNTVREEINESINELTQTNQYIKINDNEKLKSN